jgi:hypothetical protein
MPKVTIVRLTCNRCECYIDDLEVEPDSELGVKFWQDAKVICDPCGFQDFYDRIEEIK